jgi:hypothetical protein
MKQMLFVALAVLCALHRSAHTETAKRIFESTNYPQDVNPAAALQKQAEKGLQEAASKLKDTIKLGEGNP